MKLINLTPHAINIVLGPVSIALPSDGEARVDTATESRPPVCSQAWGDIEIPTERVHYAGITGLPDPLDGVGYVVSLVVVDAARRSGRYLLDLFSPGQLVRDERGVIIGCRSLARHS
jgi:hypothetical protein